MTHAPTRNGSSNAPTRQTSPSSSVTSTPARTRESRPSLYQGCRIQREIDSFFLEMMTASDEEQVELQDVITEYLAASEASKAQLMVKVDNICTYIDDLTGSEALIEQEIKRLKDLKDRFAKKRESLHRYMMQNLQATFPADTKFTTTYHEISSRRSTSVEITDEDLLPEDMLRTKTTTSPDKDLIKKAIQSGQEIPGAQLKTNLNWTIK